MKDIETPPVQDTPKPAEIKEPKVESKPEPTPKQKPEPKPDVKPTEKAVEPTKYNLKLPKDTLLNSERLEEVAAFAKEKGLSQEDAQSLVKREHDAVGSYVEEQKSKLEDMKKEWVEEVKADKDMGGEAFTKNAELARQAVDRFAPELKPLLDETGYGDHPAMFKAFARIGKAMAEDRFVKPGDTPAGSKPSTADVLYGNKSKEEMKK